MRNRLIALAIFSGLIFATLTIESAPSRREFVESVTSFICPAKNGDISGLIHLGNSGVKSATIDRKNRSMKKSNARTLPLSNKARVVPGDAARPIATAARTKSWFALTQCSSSAGEYWFVGGNADASSFGFLQFTNENLGKAIIDLELWSEDGSESTRTLTIPARSTKSYSLTTFMPGKKSTTFHILSRSGLVNVVLLDERRRGLKNLGGDFVSPSASPARTLVIPGVPGSTFTKKTKLSSQKLRLFIPGESDAIVHVTYVSRSGVFAPVGLDSLRVPAQKVVEVDLSNLPKEKLFSLTIDSSEPAVAGVLTRGTFSGQTELMWSSSAEATSGETFALPERAGYLTLVTKASKVRFTLTGSRGKKSTVTVKVDQMNYWKAPATARKIEFSAGGEKIYLALLVNTSAGVAESTFTPSLAREVTELPALDPRLYIPTN